MSQRVTILGGGNGARAAAAELGINGHQVTLYELPQFAESLEAIKNSGVIFAEGVIHGQAPVTVADDLGEAVENADIVLIIVPTNHQVAFATHLLEHLRDDLHIVVMPGSLGSLAIREYFDDQGVTADITISEIAALPYATRITGPHSVHIFGRRRYLSAGVFPAVAVPRVMPKLADVYPGIITARNVIEAGLNNPNPTLHCLGVLLSASRIESSHGDFYYYEEGMTPSVCRAIEAIDAERVQIGQAYGVEVLSLIDTYPVMGYGPKGDTFWSVIRGVSALNGIKGPSVVDSRYLTEDVPVGLTIYSQLGRLAGVEVNLMESVIHLVSALLGRDFHDDRRTLERCGLAGMSPDEIRSYVEKGTR